MKKVYLLLFYILVFPMNGFAESSIATTWPAYERQFIEVFYENNNGKVVFAIDISVDLSALEADEDLLKPLICSFNDLFNDFDCEGVKAAYADKLVRKLNLRVNFFRGTSLIGYCRINPKAVLTGASPSEDPYDSTQIATYGTSIYRSDNPEKTFLPPRCFDSKNRAQNYIALQKDDTIVFLQKMNSKIAKAKAKNCEGNLKNACSSWNN